MSVRVSALLAALLVVVATEVGFAQSPDDIKAVRKELEAIKQAQAAMQKDIAALKAILQRPATAAPRPAAVGATVSLAGAAFKGHAGAPVTIVEFSDYQCPFCGRHVQQTLPQLDREYIQTGKVKYVFRNMPIESTHPNAFKAAEAAECANELGRFWPMHDRLFASQQVLAAAQLPAHAAAVGLDPGAFQQCFASGKFAAKIRKDISDAAGFGITGTPGFLVGRTVPGSPTLRIEALLVGAKPFASFKLEIDKLLGTP